MRRTESISHNRRDQFLNKAGVTMTFENMLQVVMTPSSMRLTELLLCLWWRGIRVHGLRRDTALQHLLMIPPGNDSLCVWFGMTSWDWWQSSHKGQWRFYNRSLPHSGMMTLGHYYDLHETNAGEHWYGGSCRYLSCLPGVPIRFQLMWRGGNGRWINTIPKDDLFAQLSLAATARSASITLPIPSGISLSSQTCTLDPGSS
jgi:hypothetical protein